jgi:hypothetical protein
MTWPPLISICGFADFTTAGDLPVVPARFIRLHDRCEVARPMRELQDTKNQANPSLTFGVPHLIKNFAFRRLTFLRRQCEIGFVAINPCTF